MAFTLLDILKRIPILNDVDEDELAAVIKKVELKTFPKEKYVFHEGDSGDLFYVIKSGKVEVLRQDDNGKKTSIALLYPDNFFGEMALLSENPRNASIKCIENCELYMFNKKDFYDFLYL